MLVETHSGLDQMSSPADYRGLQTLLCHVLLPAFATFVSAANRRQFLQISETFRKRFASIIHKLVVAECQQQPFI